MGNAALRNRLVMAICLRLLAKYRCFDLSALVAEFALQDLCFKSLGWGQRGFKNLPETLLKNLYSTKLLQYKQQYSLLEDNPFIEISDALC